MVQRETLFPSHHSYPIVYNVTKSDYIICLKGNPVPWISSIFLSVGQKQQWLEHLGSHMLPDATLNEYSHKYPLIKERVLISLSHWITVGTFCYRSLTLSLLIQLFRQRMLASLGQKECVKLMKRQAIMSTTMVLQKKIHIFFLSVSCICLYILANNPVLLSFLQLFYTACVGVINFKAYKVRHRVRIRAYGRRRNGYHPRIQIQSSIQ